jgi:hypothetical protein
VQGARGTVRLLIRPVAFSLSGASAEEA